MTTTFNVVDEAGLRAVLADIGSGADAAANTAYTITLANNVGLTANASVTLQSGSSVTLSGPGGLILSQSVTLTATGTVLNATQATGVFDLLGGVLSNAAGSQVTGGVYGIGASDTVANSGVIQNSGTYGVDLKAGTVTNFAGAAISGAAIGVYILGNGSVTNAGTIQGASNQGVDIVGTGTITNTGTGHIIGASNGAFFYGPGTLVNTGTISGAGGTAVLFSNGGTITNGALGDASGLISGVGTASDGADIFGAGVVTNYATVVGGASGLLLDGGGHVTNETGGRVSGADAGIYGVKAMPALVVTNAGTIKATGTGLAASGASAVGVLLGAGGEVDNGFGGVTSASISGFDDGIAAQASAIVTNDGTISGANGVDLQAGGSVTNGTSLLTAALISGSNYGVRITGPSHPGATVTNFGTILGGVDLYGAGTSSVGTVTNAGSIGVIGGLTGTALRFGTGVEVLVLQAGGSFGGAVEGSTDAGSVTTLELAFGTTGTLSGLAGAAGTVADAAGSFSFSRMAPIQIDAGASWALAGTNAVANLIDAGTLTEASGTLAVSGTLTIAGQFVAGSGSSVLDAAAITGGGTLVVGSNAALLLQDASGGATGPVFSGASTPAISFSDATGKLTITDLAGVPATTVITNFIAGDIIALPNVTVASKQVVNTNTLDLFDLSHALVGALVFDASAVSGVTLAAGIQAPACFASGTRIRTPSGETAVEMLAVGDLVVTASGAARPVVWIGRRHVVCAQHAVKHGVHPVRIAPHVFGPGLPARPLFLSPEHALFIDGVLVPVSEFVGAAGIAQIAVGEITYWHVELDTHDVILAEGLPAETYLDHGRRGDFEGQDVFALHPLFAATEGSPYAPLVRQGPVLEAIRGRLREQGSIQDAQ